MKIAFISKMRGGKDTAAEYLLKYLPNAKIIKFADPLYGIESIVYKYIGYPIPEEKSKRRGFLQFIGTQFGRETVDPNIWIKMLEKRLDLENDYFITDCRFPNEAELLAKHGFNFIHILADESIRVERGATNLTHESETALDNYPLSFLENYYVVNNNDSLKDFYQKLDLIYARMSKL